MNRKYSYDWDVGKTQDIKKGFAMTKLAISLGI